MLQSLPHTAAGREAFSNSRVVIPAKAGIHVPQSSLRNGKIKMDPGFRRDDDSR